MSLNKPNGDIYDDPSSIGRARNGRAIVTGGNGAGLNGGNTDMSSRDYNNTRQGKSQGQHQHGQGSQRGSRGGPAQSTRLLSHKDDAALREEVRNETELF